MVRITREYIDYLESEPYMVKRKSGELVPSPVALKVMKGPGHLVVRPFSDALTVCRSGGRATMVLKTKSLPVGWGTAP